MAYEVTVSRCHAILLPGADGLRLIDLESTNGTLLNGVPIPPEEGRRLNDGDLIQLGRVLARYSAVPPQLRPLGVINPRPPICQALAQAPFSDFLAIHADLDTALAALVA